MRRDSDYGGQPVVQGRPWVFVVAAALIAGPLLVVVVRHDLAAEASKRAHALLMSRAFTGTGKVCPEITPADLAARGRPLKNVFGFHQVWFARRFGHADYALVGEYEPNAGDGYPACRFTAPAVLRVTTVDQDRVFDVGVGQAATVTVRDGVARCALTEPFPFP
ncbi:hypothetical protein BH11PSE1_BH11PSE1_23030 [soil metagenome]